MASRSLPASGRPAAGPPAAWQCVFSPDHHWALIYDEYFHNLAEIHRPLLPTGRDAPPAMRFEEAVLLMRSAPQLLALLQDLATSDPGEAGARLQPGGYRARTRSLLRSLGMLPAKRSEALTRSRGPTRDPPGPRRNLSAR
jgi:hypothetical protein